MRVRREKGDYVAFAFHRRHAKMNADPIERLYTVPDLKRRWNCPCTIWRRVKEGRLAKPIRVSHKNQWTPEDVARSEAESVAR